MKSYAILAGGGVKGPALAGCLDEALTRGVSFAGYGGSSAGAIVATLAAVGFEPVEILRNIETHFRLDDFVGDDKGLALSRVRSLKGGSLAQSVPALTLLIRQLWTDLGLYGGEQLRVVLTALMRDKLGALKRVPEITFQHLAEAGCPPLKILATDIDSRTPVVYSAAGGHEYNGSVVDAVRASISYPFMFKPVRNNDRLHVDGGLCSNLPVLLFAKERRLDRLPLFAFDLASLPAPPESSTNLLQYSWSLLQAAVSSSDYLARWASDDVHYVPVMLDDNMGPFDSGGNEDYCSHLFDLGRAAVADYFNEALPQWSDLKEDIHHIQAQHQSSVGMVEAALTGAALSFETETRAGDLRAFVLLRAPSGRLVVVYESRLGSGQALRATEFDSESGSIGYCYQRHAPCAADVEGRHRADFVADWRLTGGRPFGIPEGRLSLHSFPIFDTRSTGSTFALRTHATPLIGVLCFDSSTPLRDTGWTTSHSGAALELGAKWADVLGRVLA